MRCNAHTHNLDISECMGMRYDTPSARQSMGYRALDRVAPRLVRSKRVCAPIMRAPIESLDSGSHSELVRLYRTLCCGGTKG